MGTKVYFIGKLKRKIIKDYFVLRSIVDQQTPDQCTVTHNVVSNVQPKSITTKDQASNITEWSIYQGVSSYLTWFQVSSMDQLFHFLFFCRLSAFLLFFKEAVETCCRFFFVIPHKMIALSKSEVYCVCKFLLRCSLIAQL